MTNHTRNLSWDDYCKNLLSHSAVLNPVGILKGFNTRAYEVLYSGRMLLQHTYGTYPRHLKLVQDCQNVIMFDSIESLKSQLGNVVNVDPTKFYNDNNFN